MKSLKKIGNIRREKTKNVSQNYRKYIKRTILFLVGYSLGLLTYYGILNGK